MTNNATSIIDSQLPEGVTSWWDSVNNKLTPSLDGDSYIVNLRFTAISSSPTGLADVDLDVGGTLGVVDGSTISLCKGLGNSQRISLKFDLFAGSTFLTNGGTFYIQSFDGDISVYNVSIKVTRVHKAK